MDMILNTVGAIFMVFGSLAAASTLSWVTWESCFRMGFPQASGLVIGNLATVGLFAIPHGSWLTLMLAYSAAAALPIWIAGKVSFHRNVLATSGSARMAG